jgi:hypothetical protein
MVSKCTLKAAHLAAVLGQYDNAIEKFESVAAASVDNQLTKWSVKEYFLKAGLCQLCTAVRFLEDQYRFVWFLEMSLTYNIRILFESNKHWRNIAIWMCLLKALENTSFCRYVILFLSMVRILRRTCIKHHFPTGHS